MIDHALGGHVHAQGFELKRCLGRGSMGVVYVARERRLERDVALKALLTNGPDELYRIKKEFRALAGIVHPNLVRLYEMHAHGSDAFFTMELVDGVPFHRAFDPPLPSDRRVDVGRLRDGVAQLARGLQALHESGRVHRDIKPTNVLVEPTGRVVVVDFGLAHDLHSGMSRQSQLGAATGTLGYMSPEQAWGQPLTPASDFYALGVLLYELLTGRMPPSPLESLGRDRARRPLYPSLVARDTPEDLDRLVFGLLQEDPAARPGARDIAALLRRDPAVAAAPAPGSGAIVGRTAEMGRITEAFVRSRGVFGAALVQGPSGIGKTVLLRELLGELELGSSALVLRATCHPRESLLFKAIDGLVDDLVRHLARDLPERVAALLPPGTELLARLFPVLGRLREPATQVPSDPYEVRQRAFAAFAEILRRVARRQRVILWIDDLQWADADSLALLRAVLEADDCPAVFLVVSHRDGVSDVVSQAAATIRAAAATEPAAITLAPLTEEQSIELALRLLGASRRDEALPIARESAGDPLLAHELARFLATGGDAQIDPPLTLAKVVTARMARLSGTARRVLEVVALATEPVVEEVAHAVARVDVDTGSAVAELVAARLLGASVLDGLPGLDVVHARIRESVVAAIAAADRRSLHSQLARLLEAHAAGRPERFVEHHALAGEPAVAAERAIAAAERAARSLAFHQACLLYEMALELTEQARGQGASVGRGALPKWEILERLGAALVSAGKGGAGARHLQLAAEELARVAAEDARVLQLTRRAAEQYMRSGMHGEGLALLRRVLAAARLRFPSSTADAVASMLLHRARLGDQLALEEAAAAPRRLTALERERLEVCWSAGAGLSLFDLMRTGYFQAKHAVMARDAGDVDHLARALSMSGLLAVWEGGARRARKGWALLHTGQRLADRLADPNIQALSLLTRVIATYYEARYEDAVAMAERGERMCREECSSGAWELANFQVVLLYALARLGRFERLSSELTRVLREARERDDRFCLVTARLGSCSLGWIAAGQLGVARAEVEDALAGPFPSTYTWQVYQGAFALGQIDLYEDAAQDAWERTDTAWRELQRKQMLRLMATRVEMRDLRARAALRLASARGLAAGDASRGAQLRFVRSAIDSLRAEDAPWVDPYADALEAGSACVGGDARAASRLFEQAALGFGHFRLAAHAASARYQAARAVGADLGPARDALGALGVVDAAVFANMLTPAFRSEHGR